ncbi:MAG: putative non-F420 flavinoid oxidoreductase [Fibrobacteres bacterium]|nr:putative non-F420 flavinoid oxidoreductase [Fibrobacterota bacterium]
MVRVYYHASHEQFPPGRLLEYARLAERAGFKGVFSSDHFQPWSLKQGESGFSWSWLGAAMQATSLPFGMICAPGQRYHPAIVAQAAATLSEMFPDRFWMAIGSGQALNEAITGERWPSKEERNERLRECADILRRLWAGEIVNHRGRVMVQEARLHTLPSGPFPLVGAAVTARTARWLGSWADGLLTVSRPPEELRKVVDAFREGGGAGKPVYLKVQLSYDQGDRALEGAWEQWKPNILENSVLTELRHPEQLDDAARYVRREDLHGSVRISGEVERHLDWLRADIALGIEHLILHNVNLNQRPFIEAFGERVLPGLAGN